MAPPQCVLCQNRFDDDERQEHKGLCSHSICKQCLHAHRRRSCPYCKIRLGFYYAHPVHRQPQDASMETRDGDAEEDVIVVDDEDGRQAGREKLESANGAGGEGQRGWENVSCECDICFNNLGEKHGHIPKMGTCGHTFCSKCVARFKGVCPNCGDLTFVAPKTNFKLNELIEAMGLTGESQESETIKRLKKENADLRETLLAQSLRRFRRTPTPMAPPEGMDDGRDEDVVDEDDEDEVEEPVAEQPPVQQPVPRPPNPIVPQLQQGRQPHLQADPPQSLLQQLQQQQQRQQYQQQEAMLQQAMLERLNMRNTQAVNNYARQLENQYQFMYQNSFPVPAPTNYFAPQFASSTSNSQMGSSQQQPAAMERFQQHLLFQQHNNEHLSRREYPFLQSPHTSSATSNSQMPRNPQQQQRSAMDLSRPSQNGLPQQPFNPNR